MYVLYGLAEAQSLAPICFIALARNSGLKRVSLAGLPDGLFSNQKSQFGYILEGLKLENVYIICGHSEYFTGIWDILRPFGTFCVRLVHFSGFGIMFQEKSGNPETDL
jgi:hypothetical protein